MASRKEGEKENKEGKGGRRNVKEWRVERREEGKEREGRKKGKQKRKGRREEWREGLVCLTSCRP